VLSGGDDGKECVGEHGEGGVAVPGLPSADGVAPATKELVDTGVRRIVDDCYAEAIATLQRHREQLDRLADTLIERETLNEEEPYAAAGIRGDTAPAAVARGEVRGKQPAAPGMQPDPKPVDDPEGVAVRTRFES
jgi:cell division protease FtsH